LHVRAAAEKSTPAKDTAGAAVSPDKVNATFVTTPTPFTAVEPKPITCDGVVAAALAALTPQSETAKVSRDRNVKGTRPCSQKDEKATSKSGLGVLFLRAFLKRHGV
jgi:hypothetical protein